MMTTGPEREEPTHKVLKFLDEPTAEHLLSHLRGIELVRLRLLGRDPHAGAEVTAFLKARGYAVEFEKLENMVPPPLRRVVVQYRGRIATVTLAPDTTR